MVAELELLTTTIYVFNHLESKTAVHIIGGVEKIKGSKYSKARIEKGLEHLPFFNKEVPVCW